MRALLKLIDLAHEVLPLVSAVAGIVGPKQKLQTTKEVLRNQVDALVRR